MTNSQIPDKAPIESFSQDDEPTPAQSIGCLISFLLIVVLLIVPWVIAWWRDEYSDGTEIYPPIGVLIFWLLTATTLLTGKIPYRSEDMDLNQYPVLKYLAALIFGLSALGMYVLYLGMLFHW